MRTGVKTLAETSGAGAMGAAGEAAPMPFCSGAAAAGRALASNRLQIYTILLSIT